MDADGDHMQFYTFMRLKLGDSATKILQNLHTVFGPTCVTEAQFSDGLKLFKENRDVPAQVGVKGVHFQFGTKRTLSVSKVCLMKTHIQPFGS